MITLLEKQIPPLHLWTTSQYEQMAISGVLKPEEKQELVGGIVYERKPQSSPHSTGISAVEALLATIMPNGMYRKTQMPLRLGDRSMPEPDIAIVEGSFRDFEKNHPTTATLASEVRDTTLRFDRSEKLSLYASQRTLLNTGF